MQPTIQRNIIVGRNSKVWLALQPLLRAPATPITAIGHSEIDSFAFAPTDRLWVLSYSRDPAENERMLQRLAGAGAGELVYLSSSSVIVAERSACYEYPRVKQLAEACALAKAHSRVLTVGLMIAQPDELPAGRNIATTYQDLARFIDQPGWVGPAQTRQQLFSVIERPFRNALEAGLYGGYALLMGVAGPWPCLLRPIDLLLRALHMRWYGYTFLANKLWISKIS